MSRITIPRGQSVRQVAERLGVAVESLQKHAGVADVEAPAAIDRMVDVPDGFLAGRPKRGGDPHYKEMLQPGGMSSVLALDIEYRRTRVAGGMKKNRAGAEELLGLEEARRAYLRFEAESNDLAIDLYHRLTQAKSIEVRAAAAAGEGQAYAARFHRFGAPAERARRQGLSAAQAALMADPKLPAAHLAMAQSLLVEPSKAERSQARVEIERGLGLDKKDVWCWSELADFLLAEGELEDAAAASSVALECDAANVLALESAARVALARGEAARARELLERAVDALRTYANPAALLARELARQGGDAGAMQRLALERALSSEHREHVRALMSSS